MKRITEYLNQTARRLPEKEAFRDEGGSLTFAELRDDSRRIATALLQYGSGKQPILIFMEKSKESVAALLGAAYSGNFYTPVDTKMPEQRLKKITGTLSPAAVITDRSLEEKAKVVFSEIPVLIFEELVTVEIDEERLTARADKIDAADTLYVLFTSGSTGDPKGVVISHRAAIHYTAWLTEDFQVTELDVIGNEAPLYFDLSIQDVYAPLVTGCTTVLIDRKRFSFPTSLMGFLADQGVTMIMWVPSMLCMVANLKGLTVRKKPTLSKIFFCGEVMPNKQLNQWRATYPDALVVNFYGPTEACDACGYFKVERAFSDEEPLPIGFAAPDMRLFLLDETDAEIEENGQIGELCISGPQLADGYYHDPERTAASFQVVPSGIHAGEPMYRTGDLAERNEFGELMYVSRKDFQIKHLGHRIELGEIETAASAAELINECCCVYDEKNQKIVLFYSGRIAEEDLDAHLAARLQHYMLPGKKVRLRTLPHNANGKIDRNALKGTL